MTCGMFNCRKPTSRSVARLVVIASSHVVTPENKPWSLFHYGNQEGDPSHLAILVRGKMHIFATLTASAVNTGRCSLAPDYRSVGLFFTRLTRATSAFHCFSDWIIKMYQAGLRILKFEDILEFLNHFAPDCFAASCFV